MCTLLNSGSSHCFINSSFVADHNISTISISLIGLHLFDGSCNTIISQAAKLLVIFPCSEAFNLTFYVTSLNSSCSSVLGYNWLRQYNPLIDWCTSQITFHSDNHKGQALPMSPVVADFLLQNPPLANPPSGPPQSLEFSSFVPIPAPAPIPDPIPNPISTPILEPNPSQPHISMINATAYMWASKLPSSISFQLSITPDSALVWAAHEVLVDLSLVPEDYHKFTDIFSKHKADVLPPHHSYNLQIDLEEGTLPPN